MQILEKNKIGSQKEKEKLWKLYYETYAIINEESPCKQSYDRNEFLEVLDDPEVIKFILINREDLAGLALITNNLQKVSWISEPYFQKHFPDYYNNRRIYYIKAFVIAAPYQGHFKYVFSLLRAVIEYIDSKKGVGAFDCSERINKLLPLLIRKIGNRIISNEEVLDKQLYYLMT